MSRILFALALLLLWPMSANAAPTIGAACTAGAANTETPWSNFADLNAFTTASCISSVWTLIPVQPGAAQEACAAGTAGQIQWTDSVIKYCDGSVWQTVSSTGAGSTLNGITAATGNQAGIANAAYTIVWNWDTLAGGSALKLASTSTAAAGNAQKMLEVALSGTNATASQTTYGAYISNTHDGATSTNYGLYATASGGTSNNYAIEGTTSGTTNYATAGVYGRATGASGVVYGVYGVVSASGTGYGVFGDNTASGGTGVFGQADTGSADGVVGWTNSTTNGADGVRGRTAGATGATYGVSGRADSTTAGAAAVYGSATGATGATYGVYGTDASSTGFGGYFTNSGGGYALATGLGNVGIGTTAPTKNLSFTGQSAQTIWMERQTTANTAGNNLTIQASGATSGATDKAGGNLILSSGTVTGSASNYVIIQAGRGGSAGTSDTAPVEVARFANYSLGLADGADLMFNSIWDQSATYLSSDNAYAIVQNTGGTLEFDAAPSGTAGTGVTFTKAMEIDSTAKVKIGAAGTAMSAMGVCGLSR